MPCIQLHDYRVHDFDDDDSVYINEFSIDIAFGTGSLLSIGDVTRYNSREINFFFCVTDKF
jgi:hypothetical protein